MTVSIDGREMTFTGVDLNVWFAEALRVIESASDERLTAVKESLAKSIEATLVPFEGTVTPVRELPFPPTISGWTVEATKRPHDDPSVLALWDYSFTYEASRDAHDEVIAYIEPGTTSKAEATAPDDERLFRALARFQLLRAEATPDLFVELAEEVAAAFAAHRPAQPPPDVARSGENPEATFNIFTTRSASAVVKVVRNRATETFRFVAEATAPAEGPSRLTHTFFNLGTLGDASLEELLDAFFRALLSGNPTVQLAAAYRHSGSQIPITIAQGNPLASGWTAQVAQAIRDWFGMLKPEIDAESALTFHLTVFQDGAPVIEIRDLYLSSSRFPGYAGDPGRRLQART